MRVQLEFRTNTSYACYFLIRWHSTDKATVWTCGSCVQYVYEQWWDGGYKEVIVTPRARSRLEDHVIVLKARSVRSQDIRPWKCPPWGWIWRLQAAVGLRLYLCLKHSMMVALQPPFSRSLDLVVWWGLIPQLTYYRWTGLWLRQKNKLRKGLACTLVLMQSNCQRDQSHSLQIKTN